MFGFKNTGGLRYAALVEVGSGSVLISIIASDSRQKSPEIIWSHREIAPLKTDTNDIPAKRIMGTIMNAVLLIDSAGYKAMKAHDPSATIDSILVSIGAPWSYTVSKSMTYSQDEPFTVTNDILGNLIQTLEKKADEDRAEFEIARHNGITITHRTLSKIMVNGYTVKDPKGREATDLKLTYRTMAASSPIVEAVEELIHKVRPRAEKKLLTFIHLATTLINSYNGGVEDYAVVDITYEATEVAIIRDGVIVSCSFIPAGMNTLARSYAKAIKIPHEEAYSFMRQPYHDKAKAELSKEKAAAAENVTAAYQSEVQKLFSLAGDRLAVPKNIYVHTPEENNTFLNTLIRDAAKHTSHAIHCLYDIPRADQIKIKDPASEGAKVAALFFHNHFDQDDVISL